MFHILIHSDLYQSLRDSNRDLRSRVRKTLVRLRDGLWGGGTRVKRLQGVNRPVFEARTDRGDRLLFTAIRSSDPMNPERLSTHLQVWDIVSHDAVNRVKRRNHSADAEFLEFRVEEQFDIEEPPPAPEATLDSIPNPDNADPLLNFLLPPDGYEPRADEGITGAVRWFQTSPVMLADDDEFQRIIDHDGSGLELKLTREQYAVLLSPGPALVAGSAGSGKTTIAVHRLAAAAFSDPPIRTLYISYSPWLVDHARKLYHDVMVARGAPAPSHAPHFTTFTDLYLRLLPAAIGEQLDSAGGLVTAAEFRSWFVRSGVRLDAALVWEEIRSILKGACTNLGKVMLEEADYLELGRKRAPLFVNERPEIFKIAVRYQQWLENRRQQDQIDICRRAFLELRHGHHKRYDVIVCDEVQDLTEIEIAFVLSLSVDPAFTGIMLSGDTQQIVNPSGFRWAEVRQSILRATRGSKAPALLRLRRNFRSVRPVVELANSILTLRREIYGRSDEDDPEEAALEGPAPIQVLDEDNRVLEAIRDFGPRCAVLTFNETDRDNLRRTLDTTRIFHIQDAKGLEFDTVVLWKVLGADPALVGRFLRIERQELERDARFRHFLQHLYVALTRARRHVAVFEGADAHPFWNGGPLHNRLERESAEALARLFRESAAPAEWIKEAEYYFERQRYRQAAECFRRAGYPGRELEAQAMFAESVHDWINALSRWERLGNLERQAPLLERMARFDEALQIYRRLGRTDKVTVMEVQSLERQGRWAEAGQRWETIGKPDDAARCYYKSGNRARALSFEAVRAEAEKNWLRAAECWWEIRSWESAARCFRKAKLPQKAALADAARAESQRDWAVAATAYRRAGERRLSDECRARAYEGAGKLKEAAKIWERLQSINDALRLYRKIGDAGAIDRIEFSRLDFHEDQTRRVTTLLGTGKHEQAIRVAAARRKVLRQELARRLPAFSRRELNFEYGQLGDIENECRARMAERAGNWDKAVYFWMRTDNYPAELQARTKAIESLPDPAERIAQWFRFNKPDLAIACLKTLSTEAGHAVAAQFEEKQKWIYAAMLWDALGEPVRSDICMQHLEPREPEPQQPEPEPAKPQQTELF